MSKLIDCITFFDNNFMFEIRYNILVNHVDYFLVCESLYDHSGKRKKQAPKKKLNGKLKRPTSFHNIRRSWQGSELDISGKSPGHMEV